MADTEQTIEELMMRMGIDINALRSDIRQFKRLTAGMVEDADKAGLRAASAFVSRTLARLRADMGRIKQAAWEGFLPDEAALRRSETAIKRFNARILKEMRRHEKAGTLDDSTAALLGGSLRSIPKRPRKPFSNAALETARHAYERSIFDSRMEDMTGLKPNPAKIREQAIEAAKIYNQAITNEILRLEGEGKLDDETFKHLSRAMKPVPTPHRDQQQPFSNAALTAARRTYNERMLESQKLDEMALGGDPKGVRDRARKAAQEYNATLRGEIARLGKEGKLDDATFDRLMKSMKRIPPELRDRTKPDTRPVDVRKLDPFFERANKTYRDQRSKIRISEVAGSLTPEEAREEARKVGKAYNDTLVKELRQLQRSGPVSSDVLSKFAQSMKKLPKKVKLPDSVDGFLSGLEEQYRTQRASTKRALDTEFITLQQAHEAGTKVAREFNRAVDEEIRKRHAAGTLTDSDFVRLSESMKKVPRFKASPYSPDFNTARAAYEQEMASLRAAFNTGGMKPADAQRKAHEIGAAFNHALAAEIRRALAGGDTELAAKLSKQFKPAGNKAGREFSEGFKSGTKDESQSILSTLRGIFAMDFIRMIPGIIQGIAGFIRGVGNGIDDIAQRAGSVQKLTTAFIALNNSIGESARSMLDEMRKGARGTVSDMELMLRANMALTARLPVTARSLGEAVMLARRLGSTAGMSSEEAFSRIIRGTGKLEIELLDELGLLNGVKRALQEYTAQTGKNAQNLSQAAKVQLFWNATIKEAREKVSAMGPDILTAADRVDRFKATWENLKSEIAKVIVDTPALMQVLGQVDDTVNRTSGSVERLADRLGALIDTVLALSRAWQTSGLKGFTEFMANSASWLTGPGLVGHLVGGITRNDYRHALRFRDLIRSVHNSEDLKALDEMVDSISAMNITWRGSTRVQGDHGETLVWKDHRYVTEEEARAIDYRRAARNNEPLRVQPGTPDRAPTNADRALTVEEKSALLQAINERINQLTSGAPNRPSSTEIPDRDRHKSFRERIEHVQDEMQNALDEMTESTLDELNHALDRAEREAEEAYKDSGRQPNSNGSYMPVEMWRQFQQRRNQTSALAYLPRFSRRFQKVSELPDDSVSSRGIEANIEALTAQAGAVREGSRAWRNYNAEIEAMTDDLDAAQRSQLEGNLQQQIQLFTDLTMRMQRMREQGIDEGSTVWQQYKEQLKQVNDLIRQTTEKLENQNTRERVHAAEKRKRAEDERRRRRQQTIQTAQDIKSIADATIDLAAAMGKISDDSANALKSVAQMAQGAARMAAGDYVGGAVDILSGLAGMFGESEHEKALRENSERLQQLAQKLDRALNVADLTKAANALAKWDPKGFSNAFPTATADPKEFNKWMLKNYGVSLEMLKKIADEYGIQLVDDKGKIIIGALNQLREALGYVIEDLAKFGRSLDEQRSAKELLDNLQDVKDTPQRRIQRELELMNQFAPDLAKKYGLNNYSTDTSEGRAAIKAAFLKMLQDILAGVLDPKLLGTFENLQDLVSIIQNVEGSFDELNGTLNDFNSGLENAPQGFKYALEKFNATIADQTLPRSPTGPRYDMEGSASNGSTTIRFGDVNIYESTDGGKTYRALYDEMMSQARNQGPAAVQAVLQLPKPSGS